MTIGIDKIGFATSQYVLRLSELAAARNTDPEKLSKGLLLKELSIAPITEDIVTLGASASHSILTEEEKEEIDMVILATESGIDQSKAAAVFVHGLLGIQPFARSFEMKEPAMLQRPLWTMLNFMLKNFHRARSWLLPAILQNMESTLLVSRLKVPDLSLCW